MKLSDTQLIQDFCNGNTDAFNSLVDRWQPHIYSVAYRYFNSRDEADDISQKTFIKVYKKLHTLDEAAAFPAWIYRITHNLCRDESKRAGRRRSAPMHALNKNPVSSTVEDNPEQPMHQKELGRLLQQALQKLPPEQRIVVILKEYQELKFKEIANALDVPANTVKSRLYAGLTKLRTTFDQWNINKEALYYD